MKTQKYCHPTMDPQIPIEDNEKDQYCITKFDGRVQGKERHHNLESRLEVFFTIAKSTILFQKDSNENFG